MQSQIIRSQATPQVFIVGMARSGTTLLSEILNTHSKIAVSPETHYFCKYWLNSERHSLKRRIILTKKFLASSEFKQFGFTAEEENEIKHEILEALKGGQKEILSNILTHYRLKKNKPNWAEKTTAHLMHIPEIADLFPASKFICITRDPRDVCLSLKKVPFNPGSPISIARRWKRYAKRTSMYRDAYKDIFLELKYEEFVEYPEPVIKSICGFLRIDYESDMIGSSRVPGTFSKDQECWKIKAAGPIDKNNFGKWKKEMRAAEIYFFQQFLAEEMDRYNYETSPIKSSFHVRLELMKLATHWFLSAASTMSNRIFGQGKTVL
jgi:hypothetical protein